MTALRLIQGAVARKRKLRSTLGQKDNIIKNFGAIVNAQEIAAITAQEAFATENISQSIAERWR